MLRVQPSVRVLWECYGPPDAAPLPAVRHAELRGLQRRQELNGQAVSFLQWDGLAGRFAVEVVASRERIKARPENLRVEDAMADSSGRWSSKEAPLGVLSTDVVLLVGQRLRVRALAALSGASRALRAALWLELEAEPLWEALLARSYSAGAAAIARTARPGVAGPRLFRTARGLREALRGSFSVQRGSVVHCAGAAEVVACPCMRSMVNVGIGAQGAIRRAAGPALEEAIRNLSLPVDSLSVTLLPGGDLAAQVVMTVTELPPSLADESAGEPFLRALLAFLEQLHRNVFRVVREAGLRSLAMPTLCTGGIGVPAHILAVAALQALHREFQEHPRDRLQVCVACYDSDHAPALRVALDEHLRFFGDPERAQQELMATVFASSGVWRSGHESGGASDAEL